MNDIEIKEYLKNLHCFKATVYNFVKFVHSKFNPSNKIELDYIKCFSDRPDFLFAEDVDWDEYLVEPEVRKLILLIPEERNMPPSFNIFQLYSAFYYNENVEPNDFIQVLRFGDIVSRESTRPFPEILKSKIIQICQNYQSCLDLGNETTELISNIGTQEEFIKKLLIYMSSSDVLIPGSTYTFNLTFEQQDILFAHTCFRTIDIREDAINLSLSDLTKAIILTIIGTTGFNRAG